MFSILFLDAKSEIFKKVRKENQMCGSSFRQSMQDFFFLLSLFLKYQSQISKFKLNFKTSMKIPLVPMGVLAPGSAAAWLSTQPPIDTNRIFLAHMSAKSPSKISPNPLEVISSFGTLGQLLKKKKNGKVRGVGGVPEFLLDCNPNIFVT